MRGRQPSETVNLRAHRFQKRLFQVAGGIMGAFAIVVAVVLLFVQSDFEKGIVSMVLALPALAALVLATRDRIELSAYVFLIGVSVIVTAGIFRSPEMMGPSFGVLALILILAGFTLSPRVSLVFGAGFTIALLAIMVYGLVFVGSTEIDASTPIIYVGDLMLILAAIYFLSSHGRELQALLAERLSRIDRFVPKLSTVGDRVASSSQEINVMANQQRQGALRQLAAVDETREALVSSLVASRKIAESAEGVFDNARETLANTGQLADRVKVLSEETHNINQVVEVIGEIANKSELLALNAALEGVRAGEAGRGFSLVASQMQRLAENVTSSLDDIKILTTTIKNQTDVTTLSLEQVIKLVQSTTDAGREISLLTNQQQTSTEQIAKAIEDIGDIMRQVNDGSEQALVSTKDLADVAGQMPRLIDELTSPIEGNTEDDQSA